MYNKKVVTGTTFLDTTLYKTNGRNMHFNPLIPELIVSDIKNSLAFYVDLLGFNVNYAREEDKFYFLEREKSQIMIEEYDSSNPEDNWVNGAFDKPLGRGMNLEMAASDTGVLYNAIISANYPVYLDLEEKWYEIGDKMGGAKQFIVADPDGYLLRFTQDLGQKNK